MAEWPHSGPYVFSLGCPRETVHVDGTREHATENVPPEASNLARWVREVLDDAGFRWAVPHTFRKTVATLLAEAHIPLADTDQLGHADPSMTMSVYLGRDLEGDKGDMAAVL